MVCRLFNQIGDLETDQSPEAFCKRDTPYFALYLIQSKKVVSIKVNAQSVDFLKHCWNECFEELICLNRVVLEHAYCNISTVKCALNSCRQLCLAVNESEGSFCYKLLFPKCFCREAMKHFEIWNV